MSGRISFRARNGMSGRMTFRARVKSKSRNLKGKISPLGALGSNRRSRLSDRREAREMNMEFKLKIPTLKLYIWKIGAIFVMLI